MLSPASRRALEIPLIASAALRHAPLAAINDASHVKCFTFLHYRLSVEQNRLLPRNENKVAKFKRELSSCKGRIIEPLLRRRRASR